jgi:hypothetical protein
MATKFDTFLTEKKIDPRRILAASEKLERLHREDRAIRLARRIARKSEDGGKKKEGIAAKKPHSGRPITPRTINAARTGKDVSGPTKTRLLRAVNYLLEQKKLEKVDLKALFDLPAKGGAKAPAEAPAEANAS